MLEKIFTSAKFVFLFPALIFLANAVSGSNPRAYWFGSWYYSLIFHILGGASMAIIFFYFFEKNKIYYSFKSNWIIVLILAVAFSALIGVLWELCEFTLDQTSLFGFPMQGGLTDTMLDLFFDIIGGFLAVNIYFKSKLYKESNR